MEVEEAEIIPEGSRPARTSESEFHHWLKKDLKKQGKFVDWKHKKRSVFDKIGFNENHIPHQGNYPKDKKKERLAQWDNPKFNWPPVLPPPTMHRGRTLLNHIDSEERKRIQKEREFSIPNYRTGDVVELSMFQSISDAKITTFKGLVYGRAKTNNLRHTLWFQSVADNVGFSHKVKIFSPMLARMQILKHGSNQNRKKLAYIPKLDLTGTRLMEPIIHGKGYKARSATVTKSNKKGRKESVLVDGEVVERLVLEDLDDRAIKKSKVKLDLAERYEK